ncbi:MAG TPA: efflux RND transporter periplasmic adaptor subunit [Candidatus Acidoferrales bacterium]|jgi:RND family efflux transporter MFP subunit|nr:efflux RND transporter periplasmic adaptor subunit [Candidatus Acidoferrales bacterium]
MTEQLNEQRVNPPAETRRSGRGKLILMYLVPFVLFAAVGIYAISAKRNASRVLAQQTTSNAVPIVDVVHASTMNAASDLVLPGALEAYVDSPIYARTDGYLKKWYRDIGSRVKQGELLADIETPEVDQQLQQAQADLTTAKANLSLSAITAARYQDLLKTDSVSKQEVDNANGDLAAKKSIVESADANLRRLEQLKSFEHVYAPFSGVITQRNVDTGTLINSGNAGSTGKSLFVLAQIDPLRVFVAVPQTYAPSVREGQRACLVLAEFTGKKFCGAVARTADAIDPTTRTLRTEVDVPNASGELLPGSYAEVHFDLKISGERLSLPVNALLFRPDGTMAAVVEANNHIELKRLTIGRDFGSSVEVLQGLDASDAVVLNPPDSLEAGEAVRVKPPTPKQ